VEGQITCSASLQVEHGNSLPYINVMEEVWAFSQFLPLKNALHAPVHAEHFSEAKL